MEKEQIESLIVQAFAARQYAYAPYSNFMVGAALLSKDGQIYSGCNIENASYTPTICAERTAFSKAVSEGVREFSAIAVCGALTNTKVGAFGQTAPCGVCRQVMAEFCNPHEFLIIMAKTMSDYRIMTLDELLPEGFYPHELLGTFL